MKPVLFEIPGLGFGVPGYGVALMIGFLLSIWWAGKRALKSRADPDVVLNCGFIALLGGVIGARAMYVWHYWEQFYPRESVGQLIIGILGVWNGGLEVYGGVIAVVVSVLLYLALTRRSIRWYLDIMAPSAALGMAIGRIGCFLNGCCWGGECDLPWAVRFPYGSNAVVQQWNDQAPGAGLPQQLLLDAGVAAQPISRDIFRVTDEQVTAAQQAVDAQKKRVGELRTRLATAAAAEKPALTQQLQGEERRLRALDEQHFALRAQMQKYGLTAGQLRQLAAHYHSRPVHPTQLYSAITLGLIAWLLSAVYWRRTRDGQVICTFLLIEPPARYVLELLRADNPVDVGAFTISQAIAFSLSAAGLIGLLLLRGQAPRSPRAVPFEPPAPASAPARA